MSDAKTDSKVSGFLGDVLASEIIDGISGPMLRRTFSRAFVQMTLINKAHLLMLARSAILDRTTSAQLMRVVLEMEREGEASVPIDMAREDAYFNYEAELIRRAGDEIGGRLHTGRSRNDLKATQDRLRTRELAIVLLEKVLDLRRALVEQARKYAAVVMTGYTHGQPAQPITYGWYLLGIESALQRDTARLLDCFSRMNQCPLGAAALAGTSFNIDRQYTAELLGFDAPVPHALDAVGSRETSIELLSCAAFVAMTISRLAQDFHSWTSFENRLLDMPDRVAITSSIMPQKKNMAALETLRGRTASVTGALMTGFMAYKGLPFSHNQDGPFESLRWAFDALDDLILALPVARLVVNEAVPLKDKMLEQARTNFSTTTDLADVLVRDAGLPFREAHHVVGRAVRIASNAGKTAAEIDLGIVNRASQEILGRELKISEATVRSAMDPVQCVNGRNSSGSPSAGQTELLAEAADASAKLHAGRVADIKGKIERAMGTIERESAALLK